MSSSNDCERFLLRKAKYTSLSHETAGAGHSIVADSKDCCLTPPPSVEFIATFLEFVNAAQSVNFMETKNVHDYHISRLRDRAERLAVQGQKAVPILPRLDNHGGDHGTRIHRSQTAIFTSLKGLNINYTANYLK